MKNSFLLELYYELSKVIKNSILLSYFSLGLYLEARVCFLAGKPRALFYGPKGHNFQKKEAATAMLLNGKKVVLASSSNFFMQMKIILSLKWPINIFLGQLKMCPKRLSILVSVEKRVPFSPL